MVFKDSSMEETGANVDGRSDEIPRVEEFKYLGAWINYRNYLTINEEQLKFKGKQNTALMER